MGTRYGLNIEPATIISHLRTPAQSILATLSAQLPLASWIVNLTIEEAAPEVGEPAGRQWMAVATRHQGPGVLPGTPTDGNAAVWARLSAYARVAEGFVLPRVADHPPLRSALSGDSREPLLNLPKAAAGVALSSDDRRITGALCGVDMREQPTLLGEQLAFLASMGGVLSAVLSAEMRAAEEARRAEVAEEASERDPLTGLGNRRRWNRLLQEEEERCRRMGIEAAIVVIDLDHLKEVNDQHGHAAGDLLLQRTARVLSKHTRLPDEVARIGGDEFAFVATDCGPNDVARLIGRLRNALRQESVTASIGHANRNDDHGLPNAWKAADAAMYTEKRRRPSGS